ncbi:MAG: prolyl-tRNA synthetase associated domain-containing protein [Clostridiales bacterium]|nr:prolyl-tRNA synthetase associated domain-containing protein [Clostridiales bacterium]
MDRSELCRLLDEQGIPYELAEHPAVFTIEEMERLGLSGDGEVAKNLFLRDGKGRRHFLVMVHKDKQVDLKALRGQLGVSQLGFASEERLMQHLGLTRGAVTPLGLLNDGAAAVALVVDRDLVGHPRLGVHPNENTATLWIAYRDLVGLIERRGNPVLVVSL